MLENSTKGTEKEKGIRKAISGLESAVRTSRNESTIKGALEEVAASLGAKTQQRDAYARRGDFWFNYVPEFIDLGTQLLAKKLPPGEVAPVVRWLKAVSAAYMYLDKHRALSQILSAIVKAHETIVGEVPVERLRFDPAKVDTSGLSAEWKTFFLDKCQAFVDALGNKTREAAVVSNCAGNNPDNPFIPDWKSARRQIESDLSDTDLVQRGGILSIDINRRTPSLHRTMYRLAAKESGLNDAQAEEYAGLMNEHPKHLTPEQMTRKDILSYMRDGLSEAEAIKLVDFERRIEVNNENFSTSDLARKHQHAGRLQGDFKGRKDPEFTRALKAAPLVGFSAAEKKDLKKLLTVAHPNSSYIAEL